MHGMRQGHLLPLAEALGTNGACHTACPRRLQIKKQRGKAVFQDKTQSWSQSLRCTLV